jgi:predicted extracellular nuclease
VQNVYNLRADRGLSDFDVRHRLVFSPVAELPFGKGKAYLSHGIASAIAGGFQLSGIFSWQTGRPFTVTDSSTNNSGSFENADRPNRIANPSASVDTVTGAKTHTVQEWFNVSAFQLAPKLQFGNAGRNIVTGPSYTDLDLTLARSFSIDKHFERLKGQFRVESFNLLNHPNFFNPLSTATQFGTSSFGQVTQANNPRQFQFAARILF